MQADPVEAPPRSAQAPAWLPVVGGALTVAALVVRWRALSDDGLLFDDAWVSLGATRASPSQLLAVSTMHPGFTGLLMLWSKLVPTTTTWIALPALLAGALLPAAVLWAGRRLDVRPLVSVVVAVLAVVAPTHVVYSGRIKPYTLETLAVLVLAVQLGPISRRRWSTDDAVLWVLAAVVVGSINAFALVAVGAAAVILVLHPCGDRAVRLVAAGVQAAVQVVLLVAMRRSFAYDLLEVGWGDTFDGYVELSPNPVASVREVATHLSRIGQVVVVDLQWLALVVVVLAAAGLGVEAWRGRHAVVARFLLVLPSIAFAGGVLELLPFGPIDQSSQFPGTRASLWLLPSVLVGLALAGERAATLVEDRAPQAARWVAGVVATAMVLVVANALRFDVTYPSPGTETVHAVIDDLDDGDLVLLMETATWSLAAVDGSPFAVVGEPESGVGFLPVLEDDRFEPVNSFVPFRETPGAARVAAGSAPGVPWSCIYVVEGFVGTFDLHLEQMHADLAAAGYELDDVVRAGQSSVEVWARPGPSTC